MIEGLSMAFKEVSELNKTTGRLDRFSKDEVWKQPFSIERNNIQKDLYPDMEKRNNFFPADGTWSGTKGNSDWYPDLDKIPDPENKKCGNPNGLSWQEILNKYKIEYIPFRDGEPDFSKVSVGEVKIEDFSTDRQRNFSKADSALAKEWSEMKKDGKEWTPREIAEWRKENGYTWHECKDCKTMQLVPQEIHNNTPHIGGISEMKKLSN